MIGPASTSPTPPPTAVSPARIPTAPVTLSAGNSSRMIPNAAGSIPPASPWITRAAIITPIDEASAASSDPAASAASDATKTRSLPYMSPTRPRIGVAIDADSRYAVSTHVTEACDVCSSCCTVVSTGSTSDCNSAKAPIPAASTANVTW